MLLFKEVDPHLRDSGRVTINIGDHALELDLSYPHERRYAACSILNLRYPQADIDRLLLEKFLKPGDAVLDGGANIGLTALEALSFGASRVVCCEPIPALAERIRQLKFHGIECLECALSDHVGTVSMTISTAHNQGSTYRHEIIGMFPHVFGPSPRVTTVTCTTIDELYRNHMRFDLWKLDLEGAEVDAIEGAAQVLKEKPPRVVLVELFAPMFEEFHRILSGTYVNCSRALISKSDYELHLANPKLGSAELEQFYPTSPMYVFSN